MGGGYHPPAGKRQEFPSARVELPMPIGTLFAMKLAATGVAACRVARQRCIKLGTSEGSTLHAVSPG